MAADSEPDRKSDGAAFDKADAKFLHQKDTRDANRRAARLKRKKRPPDGAGVIPPSKDPAFRTAGWSPTWDAASLVDYVADVILSEHMHAITSGEMPGGGAQVPLSERGQQGKRAAAGHRPKARGFTPKRGTFPMKIRRGKLSGQKRASGPVQKGGKAPRAVNDTAKVTIQPHSKHQLFVASEAKKGIGYFSVDGKVADRINAAVGEWIGAAIAGETPDADTSEREAEDI